MAKKSVPDPLVKRAEEAKRAAQKIIDEMNKLLKAAQAGGAAGSSPRSARGRRAKP